MPFAKRLHPKLLCICPSLHTTLPKNNVLGFRIVVLQVCALVGIVVRYLDPREGPTLDPIWDFPKIRVPYFGVLTIRILLFRVLY